MKSYKLIRIGKLFATRASLSDKGGTKVLTLLIDTGSTYTIIPVEILEAIGASPTESKDHVRIITGSGILMVPRVVVSSFHCLGIETAKFSVVGHTLPPAGPIDGLLGMDFLTARKSHINLGSGTIEIS